MARVCVPKVLPREDLPDLFGGSHAQPPVSVCVHMNTVRCGGSGVKPGIQKIRADNFRGGSPLILICD